MAGPPGIEPGTYGLEAKTYGFRASLGDLGDFYDFLVVDLQKSPCTAKCYVGVVRRFLSWLDGGCLSVEAVRGFLRRVNGECSRDRYNLTLSALKAYLRDFLGLGWLVAGFKHPPKVFKPKTIPSREDLRRFYMALPSLRLKAYFLVAASSGLRRGEILGLTLDDVDFERRMLRPHSHKGASKHSWVSFYNREAEEALKVYRASLKGKAARSNRLFPISIRDFKAEWRAAQLKTGLKITSKSLRDWFAEEMSRLGVADRYIDAFQGRTPASILARHYTDYSPTKLREIYEKANLKILEAEKEGEVGVGGSA
ncbi:MAG: tyrosine-type recombinase/integrase [Candidatus Bathyarchaeia archaeon]